MSDTHRHKCPFYNRQSLLYSHSSCQIQYQLLPQLTDSFHHVLIQSLALPFARPRVLLQPIYIAQNKHLLVLFGSRLFVPHEHDYKHAGLVYNIAHTSGIDLQDIVDPVLFFLANQKPLSEVVRVGGDCANTELLIQEVLRSQDTTVHG